MEFNGLQQIAEPNTRNIQSPSDNCKSIFIGKLNLPVWVDDCDYERLMQEHWHLRTLGGKIYAARKRCGQNILMHREIISFRSTDFFGNVSHHNGNTLDNRLINLNPRYTTQPRKSFYISSQLNKELKHRIERRRNHSIVHTISKEGVVVKSNITALIAESTNEIDSLLCQRLKAAQLVIESKKQLISCKQQLCGFLSKLDGVIETLNEITEGLQPR